MDLSKRHSKETEALVSSGSSDEVDSSSELNKKQNTSKFQKISGKAWGVLQFRKLRAFPFSVFFIVGNEFCERFSYYGMRAVLVLFLNDQLNFSENSSTAIYHAFVMLCYLLPLLGAIISDSCLGKYWTILSLSVVYSVGNIAMSLSAIPFDSVKALNIILAAVGMVVIALGTGGIKPCVSAFGGDQFKEGQGDLLRRFFSLFYFSINAGSVISTLLTPVLRSQINCFNTCRCFALAFGVPAVLMIVSLLIFISGTKFYVIKKPKKENALLYLNVPLSIATAIYRRIKLGKIEGRRNLLEYACPRFSEQFMEDVRLLLRVCVMLLPLPVFWALFDQQGSRWTLQATRMNGKIGKFTLQPDQMQALNPILILVLIPVFETIVYPLFGRCNLLKKPLQRMVIGMFLGGLAFIIAGVVQFEVQAGDKTLKAGETKLVMFNALPYEAPFNIEAMDNINGLHNINADKNFTLPSGGHMLFYGQNSLQPGNYSLQVGSVEYPFQMVGKSITQVVVAAHSNGTLTFITEIEEDERPNGGDSSVQIFNAFNDSDDFKVMLTSGSGEITQCSQDEFESSDLGFMAVSNRSTVTVGSYQFIVYANVSSNQSMLSETTPELDDYVKVGSGRLNIPFRSGAVYMVVVTESRSNVSSLVDDGGVYNVTGVEIDEPNSVSLFLQVPMYVVITTGEVMFSITGLEFAYSQAPVSMKAMCQAAWLLTVAFGNLVVIIIAESSLFENRAIEFFFFAALIFVVTIIFGIMAFFYKYVDLSGHDDEPSSRGSPYQGKDQDESSALIVDNGNSSGLEDGQPPKKYVSESEGDSLFDKDTKTSDLTRSESEL